MTHSGDKNRKARGLARYERILHTIDDVVFVVDDNWEIEYANQSALNQARVDRESLFGADVLELASQFVADDDVDRFERALEAVFVDEGDVPKIAVLELDMPDGQRFVEYRFSPEYEDATPKSAVIVARDVTERRQRKNRLERLLDEYELIFENSTDAVFLIDVQSSSQQSDVEFRVQRFNPAFENITGLTTEQARGKTPRELLGDELGSQVEANYRRCIAARGPITYEEKLQMPEGEITAQTSLAPVIVDEEVVQIIGISRDITARAQKKGKLQRREHQLDALHDATRKLLNADTLDEAATVAMEAADEILDLPLNGIHFYDETAGGLKPVAVSDASQELLGEVPVLSEGLAWKAFRDGEAQIYDDVREAETVYDPSTPMRSEIIIPLGEHGIFIASSPEVGAFDDSDVDLARTLAANTETALARIRKEKQLQTRTAELGQQNDRLNEFTSIVSHDLRNPLSVAQNRLDLARRERDSEQLDAIAKAHDRMERLIEDLLTLAQQGQAVDRLEQFGLPDLLSDCWKNIETKSAEVRIETNQRIRADRSRVEQLFENLIRNAIEHGGENVTVTVGPLPDGFYVADTGPGIPEDRRESVFDAGYSTSDGGTGIGLKIVEQIVNAHGWDITVTGGSGDGARFEITGVEQPD